MAIHDLKDKEGRVFAFEVDNFSINREKVFQILSSIQGVRILRKPAFLSDFREEVFCEFELNGHKFEAWEPFGDNSRYWIGPEPASFCGAINLLKEAFMRDG